MKIKDLLVRQDTGSIYTIEEKVESNLLYKDFIWGIIQKDLKENSQPFDVDLVVQRVGTYDPADYAEEFPLGGMFKGVLGEWGLFSVYLDYNNVYLVNPELAEDYTKKLKIVNRFGKSSDEIKLAFIVSLITALGIAGGLGLNYLFTGTFGFVSYMLVAVGILWYLHLEKGVSNAKEEVKFFEELLFKADKDFNK